VSADGQLVLRAYGGSPGSNAGQLFRPWHLAVDASTDRLFVVDSGNARVVLINSRLDSLLMTIHNDWFDRPWRLWFVPECHQLLVGTFSGIVDSYSIV
jgi:hypothetical protein